MATETSSDEGIVGGIGGVSGISKISGIRLGDGIRHNVLYWREIEEYQLHIIVAEYHTEYVIMSVKPPSEFKTISSFSKNIKHGRERAIELAVNLYERGLKSY